MTIDEKRTAMELECESRAHCKGCPLFDEDILDCDFEDDEFVEKYYPILLGKTSDNVNHPNHYTNGGMECIDEMIKVFGRETVAHFCLCNVWKYRYRALSKNGQQDMDKSHWYMKKYLELRGNPSYGQF